MTTLTVTAQVLTAGEGDAVGVTVRSNAETLDTVAAGILAAEALRMWEAEHEVRRYRIRDLIFKEEHESSTAIYDLADTDADTVAENEEFETARRTIEVPDEEEYRYTV